jgi:uncharacterized protein (DUF2141 family)
MRPLSLLAAAVTLFAFPATAQEAVPAAATLTITIRGVLPQPSELWLGVFDAATYEDGPAPVHQKIAAAAPETVVTFENLTPGRIAVKVLQDLNGNGEMDSTLIGFPEEPFGLSNDIKPNMSAPGFDETAFDLKPGPNAIVITMQEM